LIRRADAARRSGDESTAIVLLEQAIVQARGRPLGAIAAITLARLTMESHPEKAARALTAALASGIPRGLEEDARARLVEARAKSGDRAGARRAAAEYDEHFPGGTRADEIRSWISE
jgi:transmembrane sensor